MYSDSYDHLKNFFASVQVARQPVVEDAVFGFRAAGCRAAQQSELRAATRS